MLEMKINEHNWRVVPFKINSAPWQVAIDHALLDIMDVKLSKGENVLPIVRTYQFSRGAIVLGYDQNGSKFDKNSFNGYDFTSRISGGGHMFFSPNDIHFTAIFPEYWKDRDLIQCYQAINEPIVAALRQYGFDAKLGRTSIKIDFDKERTLAGTAQKPKTYATLQHGSILVDDYNDHIFDLLQASPEERKVWRENVITLSALKNDIYPLSVAELVVKNFSNNPGIDLTEEEILLARKYYTEFYTNFNWIKKGKQRKHICILEGLMTKDYSEHLKQNSGVE